LALAVHGYAVTLTMLPVSARVSNADDFTELTVLNSNLLLVNKEVQAQLDFIEETDPDIIAFQEYTHAWHEALTVQLKNYPHRAAQPSNGAFGIALYSKYPIVSGGVDKLSLKTPLVVDVSIDIGESLIQVIAVHPPPPTSLTMYDIRNELMEILAQRAAKRDDALIVMGDFNATPWTAHFSDMESKGNLRNARNGHGLNPTWPNNLFVLQIPIDHILVSSRVGIVDFGSKRIIGSDHRAIWSRLRVY